MTDQVKVNDAAWKALPQEHRDAISDIVSQAFGQVTIVPDASAPAPQQAAAAGLHLGGGLCKLLCEVAATAGHIACGKLPPPAQAICNAGVDAGEALCKKKCK